MHMTEWGFCPPAQLGGFPVRRSFCRTMNSKGSARLSAVLDNPLATVPTNALPAEQLKMRMGLPPFGPGEILPGFLR